ncbi:uncharacterized protein LOC109814420 [Cajanus cajan]|uniref:uncharacterized protein LOC109814420 n=1 Tax=Cajanus cajan TaxID=3821 RepID=UPI00098D9851|nr:uncharacterized protein LOC109814420 [Cajanus cajan]
MDRKWMFVSRLSKEYEDGVKEFRRFAVEHAKDPSRIICPCLKCCHSKVVNADVLEEHLVCNGIDKSYSCWTKHGETRNMDVDHDLQDSVNYAPSEPDTTYEFDQVEEIVNVVEEDLRDCPEMFDRLASDANTPLYDGCTKFTRLSAVLKLLKLKAGNGWSYKSFTELLTLLKDMLPKDNVLPNRMYEAKKMLSSIGMTYEKMHACPNDCILFRNEYASLDKFPKYSPQWAKFDHDYPNFGEEPRNLRLALSTDGINPHGNDIDIYLAPLIEDLKYMWNEGVEVYDGYKEENFKLRAMLFGTINDFPAYGNLSGYSIKGKCPCPICGSNTNWMWLEHGKKNVFLGHRRFLPSKHRYRGWRKAFNGRLEEGRAPELLYGDKVFEKVKDITNKFGKPFAANLVTSGWKKSVIGTLLNVPGKSKDGINSRLDLLNMGIRIELGPIKKGKL